MYKKIYGQKKKNKEKKSKKKIFFPSSLRQSLKDSKESYGKVVGNIWDPARSEFCGNFVCKDKIYNSWKLWNLPCNLWPKKLKVSSLDAELNSTSFTTKKTKKNIHEQGNMQNFNSKPKFLKNLT